MIQNRQIQPKDKFQVWWYPTNWPECERPHWELAGAFEFPVQAFLEVERIKALDPQAEIKTTQLVNFEVKIAC